MRLLKKAFEQTGSTRGIQHHLQRVLELVQKEEGMLKYDLPGGRVFKKQKGIFRISSRGVSSRKS